MHLQRETENFPTFVLSPNKYGEKNKMLPNEMTKFQCMLCQTEAKIHEEG